MLITIKRAEDELLVEEHQLGRFLASGWEVASEEEIVPTLDSHLHKTELVSLTKDGDTRLYEINQVPAAKAQGWSEGGHDGDELEDHDSRSRAPGRVPGSAEGRGSDLGEQRSGSGSGADSGSHDEPPEGREDLDKAIWAALAKLDHGNSEHWTAYGAPSIYALRKLVDFDITKAQVEKYAPDFKRVKKD